MNKFNQLGFASVLSEGCAKVYTKCCD